MVSHVHNLWINTELVEFHAKRQIRRERQEAAVFAGYKVGEEIANIGSVAVLRFSHRDHRFLKQITKLETKFPYESDPSRNFLELLLRVCIMNGKASEENLFIDGVFISRKRDILYGFVLRTLFTNGLLCWFCWNTMHQYLIYFEHIPKPLQWM